MAVWPADANLTHDPDYLLVANGFVTLFHRKDVWVECQAMLRRRGYRVLTLDASSWNGADAMLRAMAQALEFPSYFGRNMNALADCLRDVADGDYGWAPSDTGLVLAVEHFDIFVGVDAPLAHSLLDYFARAALSAALIGNRLLCLVQSNDPEIELPPVGATRVDWNGQEWPRSSRGL